jgi:signal transduction histidine kinase
MAASDVLAAHDGMAALSVASVSEEDRRRAKVIRIRATVADAPKNNAAGLFATFLMAYVSWLSVEGGPRAYLPWGWCAVISAVAVYIISISHRFNARPRTPDEALQIANRLAVAWVCNGTVWGMLAWFTLPATTLQLEAPIFIGHAIIQVAVVGTKALYRPGALQVFVPSMVVFVAGVLRIGDPIHLVAGAGFILLSFALLSYSKVQDETFNASLFLQFKFERLLVERTAQQRLTDDARSAALEAREAAEHANRAKTTFLTAAGHDLRQPMHALVLYFGMLRRRNQDPALKDIVERMGKSLDAMQDLLDAIVEVAQLMTGAVRPRRSACSIAPLFERLEAQMRPLAEQKGLALDVERCIVTVDSDEVMLERILRNLVLNAIRYTDRGGVIVRAKLSDSRLKIRVADSGIGIPSSQMRLIFEPFHQVGNAQRDRRQGLGLGLAIVRNLVDLLGIALVVRSRQAKGSIFRISLPVASSMQGAEPRDHQPEEDVEQGVLVVLIDDDHDSLHATEQSLSLFGCEVVAARSASSAIERLGETDVVPRLIMSDYRLEHETGLEAIDQVIAYLRARHGPGAQPAACLLSGDTGPGEMMRALSAGLPMLHKPVALEALRRYVAHALRPKHQDAS